MSFTEGLRRPSAASDDRGLVGIDRDRNRDARGEPLNHRQHPLRFILCQRHRRPVAWIAADVDTSAPSATIRTPARRSRVADRRGGRRRKRNRASR